MLYQKIYQWKIEIKSVRFVSNKSLELILHRRFIIDLLFWTYLFSSIYAELDYWLTYLIQISKKKANIDYIKKASNTNNLISTAVGRQKDVCSIHWIYWNQKLKSKFFCCWPFDFVIHSKKKKDNIFSPF